MESKVKVLLLNPPGDKLYIRESYCSHVSKASYLYHPLDLVVQSGILAQEHRVFAWDAIAEESSFEETFKKIAEIQPQAILALGGAASWSNDREFFEQLRRRQRDFLLIGSGDIFFDEGAKLLSESGLFDGFLLDFTSPVLLEFLRGESPSANFLYRTDGQIKLTPVTLPSVPFAYPLPLHELFPQKKYSLPFNRHHPYITVISDYGCPYHCSFCFIGELGHLPRRVENTLEELRYLKQKGYRELRFRDSTFGAHLPSTLELLEAMIKEKFNFSWSCLSRSNVLEKEGLLELMKRAGCHTIQLGVESGDDEILRRYIKGITKEQVVQVVAKCKRLRIRVLAHFILGLPGEDEQALMRTVDLALKLDPDYASFNIATPRLGTKMRQEALSLGWARPQDLETDSSVAFPVINTPQLSAQRLWELRNYAIRTFYRRPSYIIKKLLHIRSWREFWVLIKEGTALLRTVKD
jgi:radical SAM superfamily enzyme YgiQ (UPF0313 family)